MIAQSFLKAASIKVCNISESEEILKIKALLNFTFEQLFTYLEKSLLKKIYCLLNIQFLVITSNYHEKKEGIVWDF